MKKKIEATENAELTHLNAAEKVLPHVLSPLEQVAIQHRYESFIYRFEDQDIYIPVGLCNFLIGSIVRKQNMLTDAVQHDLLCKKIPSHLHDTFEDPRIVLSLPERLRNKLCSLDCYCLFTILKRGKSNFINKHKFGKQAIKTLSKLFENYNCGDLF